MEEKKYDLGTIDIKLRCTNCNRLIMMPRIEFNKKLKKIIK